MLKFPVAAVAKVSQSKFTAKVYGKSGPHQSPAFVDGHYAF